jgi:hypothetical protein
MVPLERFPCFLLWLPLRVCLSGCVKFIVYYEASELIMPSLQIKFYFGPMCSSRNGSDKATLEVRLWEKLAKGGVLFVPGWFFSADEDANPDTETEGHYRISFSSAEVCFFLPGLFVSDMGTVFGYEEGNPNFCGYISGFRGRE